MRAPRLRFLGPSGRSLLLVGALGCARAAPAPATLDFGRDILPILSNNCFHCHGPDDSYRKGKLRLDTHAGVLGTGKSGATTVVPGKTADSELIQRIISKDDDEVMPPRAAKEKLSAKQIELLTRWVEQGAPWGKFWAFEAPAKPAIPKIENPSSEIQNPVDAFVLARLEKILREQHVPSKEFPLPALDHGR